MENIGYAFLKMVCRLSEKETAGLHNDSDLVDFMKNKFKTSYAKNLIEFSGLSLNDWSSILPVSKRTLQRELETNHIFDAKLAEPMVAMSEIYAIGLQAFDDDKERLIEWLHEKNPYFNGKTPVEILDTHKGRELVRLELIRIEYGGFA